MKKNITIFILVVLMVMSFPFGALATVQDDSSHYVSAKDSSAYYVNTRDFDVATGWKNYSIYAYGWQFSIPCKVPKLLIYTSSGATVSMRKISDNSWVTISGVAQTVTSSTATWEWVDNPYPNDFFDFITINGTDVYTYECFLYQGEVAAPPTFVNVSPSNNATGVLIQDSVSFNFNAPVTSADVTFKDEAGNTIPHTVKGIGTSTIRISPSNNMKFLSKYTATVTNVKGSYGSTTGTFTTTFTTQKDNSPLEVFNIIPPSGSTVGDKLSCQVIFNKSSLNPDTVNSDNVYLLNVGEDSIIDTDLEIGSSDGKAKITITSNETLPKELTLAVIVDGVEDINENGLTSAVRITYYTPIREDFYLKSINPSNNSLNYVNTKIRLVFSCPIRLDGLEYSLKDKNGEDVSSTPSIVGDTLTITSTFGDNDEYTFHLISVSNDDGEFLNDVVQLKFKTLKSIDDNFLKALVMNMTEVFTNSKLGGLIIFGGVVLLGIIFIATRWLWKKLKTWFLRSK